MTGRAIHTRVVVYTLDPDLDEPGEDFVLFRYDRDSEDDRIDQTIILDMATWLGMDRPERLEVTFRNLGAPPDDPRYADALR